MVKRLSAMQETRVRSLGWEDPLEKEMAAHSSILAWKIPWTTEPGSLPSMGSQSRTRLSDFTFTLSLYMYISNATQNIFAATLAMDKETLLSVCLFCLSSQRTNFISLIFAIVSFISFYFCSDFYDFCPSTSVEGFLFLFPNCTRCKVGLFICCFSAS